MNIFCLVFFVIKVCTNTISETAPDHQKVPESRVMHFYFHSSPPQGSLIICTFILNSGSRVPSNEARTAHALRMMLTWFPCGITFIRGHQQLKLRWVSMEFLEIFPPWNIPPCFGRFQNKGGDISTPTWKFWGNGRGWNIPPLFRAIWKQGGNISRNSIDEETFWAQKKNYSSIRWNIM